VLAGLPDGPRRKQQESNLQFSLRGALKATKGFASTETVETLARAEALAAQVDRPEYVVPLMEDRWRVHTIRAEFQLALSFGKQIEDIGEVRNDATVQTIGRWLQGVNRFQLGELVAAHALLVEHLDPAHRPVDPQHAQNILRLAHLGFTLALLGYIDQACSRMGEALSLARRIRRAQVLAQVLLFADMLNYYTGSPLIHAEKALALSTEQKFVQWLGFALAFRGLALTGSGQAQEAFALVTQALAQLRTIGAGYSCQCCWCALPEPPPCLGSLQRHGFILPRRRKSSRPPPGVVQIQVTPEAALTRPGGMVPP
jgi:hypothetical protein